MKDPCPRWEDLVAGDPAAPDPDRERHLAACGECREQWSAHLALAELREIPLPPLSSDLAPRLGRAVAGLEPTRLLSPARRRLMRIYWLFATFAAGLVLAQLGPASTAWLAFVLACGALLLAALPALFLLSRRLSWDLMDLVVWTLR